MQAVITTMKTLVDTMQISFCQSGGSTGLSAVFLAGLLALWHFKFDMKNQINDLFWYAFVMLLLVISPVYIWGVSRFFPELLRGNAYLWILPVVIVVMYVVVMVITRLDNHFKKIAFSIGLVCIMFLATATAYDQNEFVLVTNDSYIQADELEVFERVNDYRIERNENTILIWGPDEIMTDARRYSGKFYTIYGKDLFSQDGSSQMHQIYDAVYYLAYRRMKDGAKALGEIGSIAKIESVDAIVLSAKSFEINNMDVPDVLSKDYKLILSNDSYCVYMRD